VFRQVHSSCGGGDGDGGQSVVRQSVYSYCKDGDGAPRVYEAHSATRTGAGGLRETHKAVRDSERQLEKLEIGQHIGSRGRTLLRQRNTHTNESHDSHNFEGIEQSDEARRAFDTDWQQLTREANALWGRPLFSVDADAAADRCGALPASQPQPAAPHSLQQ
jgi:hypothetical protein